MLTSTGRKARVKHSTGAVKGNANRKSHRRPRPRHSTGRGSTIKHFTGITYDGKRQKGLARAEAGLDRA